MSVPIEELFGRQEQVTLGNIQPDLVKKVNTQLPDKLIVSLGFNEFKWCRLEPYNPDLDVVYLGLPKYDACKEQRPLCAALGTVVIIKGINSVRVSGICYDNKGILRIIGIAYNDRKEEGVCAHAVGVYLNASEVSTMDGLSSSPPVITLPNHPPYTVGIYTEAMMKKVLGREGLPGRMMEGIIPTPAKNTQLQNAHLLARVSLFSGVYVHWADMGERYTTYNNVRPVTVVSIPKFLQPV